MPNQFGRRAGRAPRADMEAGDQPRRVAVKLVVFAPTAEARADVRGRLPMRACAVVTPQWDVASSLAGKADCMVLAVPPSDGFDPLRALSDFRASAPDTAVVFAAAQRTAREQVAAKELAHEVLRYGDSAARVWGAVQGACTGALLERAAARVAKAHSLGSVLPGALAQLCAAPVPPRSVAALCAAAGVHRHTLWYQWRRHCRAQRVRVEDVVTCVLLLRASVLVARGMTWRGAATALGVHRHTLARAAKRLGVSPLPVRSSSLSEQTDVMHHTLRRTFADIVAATGVHV